MVEYRGTERQSPLRWITQRRKGPRPRSEAQIRCSIFNLNLTFNLITWLAGQLYQHYQWLYLCKSRLLLFHPIPLYNKQNEADPQEDGMIPFHTPFSTSWSASNLAGAPSTRGSGQSPTSPRLFTLVLLWHGPISFAFSVPFLGNLSSPSGQLWPPHLPSYCP